MIPGQGNKGQPCFAGESIAGVQKNLPPSGGGREGGGLPDALPESIPGGVQAGVHSRVKGLGELLCQIGQGDQRVPGVPAGGQSGAQAQQKSQGKAGGGEGSFHSGSFALYRSMMR